MTAALERYTAAARAVQSGTEFSKDTRVPVMQTKPDARAAISESEPSTQTVKTLLEAASAALRSYQYGNAAPDLARRVADEIKRKTGWGY